MASRLERKPTKPAPQGAGAVRGEEKDDSLEILQPDLEIELGGVKIVVREYRFFEGLRLMAQAKPFFDDLYSTVARPGTAPSFDDITELLGKHEDIVPSLVALACDRDAAWVRALGQLDGELLLLTWWQANSSFFIRRVMRRALQARLEKAVPSAGDVSTTTSSPPITSAHPTSSQDSLPGRS